MQSGRRRLLSEEGVGLGMHSSKWRQVETCLDSFAGTVCISLSPIQVKEFDKRFLIVRLVDRTSFKKVT